MAVQQNKKSRSRKGMRRAHDHLTPPNVIRCANCGAPTLSHVICPTCNTYRSRNYAKKAE